METTIDNGVIIYFTIALFAIVLYLAEKVVQFWQRWRS